MAEMVMASLVTPTAGGPPPDGEALAAAAGPPAGPGPPEPVRTAAAPEAPPAPPAVAAPTVPAPAPPPAPGPAASEPGPAPPPAPGAPAWSPVPPRPAAVKPWRGVLTEQATRASMAAPPMTERTRRRPAGGSGALTRAWSRALIWLTSPHSPAAGVLPASSGPFLTVCRIVGSGARASARTPPRRGRQAI